MLLLQFILQSNLLQQKLADLKLIQLAPRIFVSLLRDREQTLNVPLAQFDGRNHLLSVFFVCKLILFLEVFVVELDKAYVVRADVKQHQGFSENVLGKLAR